MAVSNKPVFAQGPRTVTAVVTAAKTTYNDTANAVKLCDAGTNGSLLKALAAIPRATVTASKLQLYISFDAGTTLLLLPTSALMAAHTVAATTVTPITSFTEITEDTPIRLPVSSSLYVATAVALAGGIVFAGQIEDF